MKTHFVFALMTVALLALVISHSRQKTLTFQNIINQAQALAAEPFEARKPITSKRMLQLNYDQYRDIRWKEDQTLWRRLGLPFQIKFFALGHLLTTPIDLYQVNKDSARALQFSEDYFDYGKNTIPLADRQQGGFGGFRIHYPINDPDRLDEVGVFLGASYFRAVARNQYYGLSARGIALNSGIDGVVEEFPSFVSFWLVQPGATDSRMKLYALLDGPSVTGSYEFIIEPGETTRFNVHAVLFFRRKVQSAGLAPLTSMFWYGENTSNTFGGFRPEVHDSDGLLVSNREGEWLWRPLSWSKSNQVNSFEMKNPQGFGLLQRDRDFSHYQDLETHYHQRPSAWIQPHGDWGKGAVKLVQLAATNEFADNVVAFWEPKDSPAAGSKLDLSYTIYWGAGTPTPTELAACLGTRIDNQEEQLKRAFAVDFGGEDLAKLPADAPLQADIWRSEGGEIEQVRVVKNTNDNTWRVFFTLTTPAVGKTLEIRCLLRQNDRPLSETWTYTWTPR